MSNSINKNIEPCNKYEFEINKIIKANCLLFDNSDSHGLFYSLLKQTIKPNNKIILEKHSHVLNLNFIDNSPNVHIKKTGIYVVNITCCFDHPGQVIVCINNIPDLSTLTNTNIIESTKIHFITIHQILYLQVDDIISIDNYLSSESLITTQMSNSPITNNPNICFKLWKISQMKS